MLKKLFFISLVSSQTALAALTPLDDVELSEYSGADGIAFSLDNFQILSDPQTTFNIDQNTVSSSVYLDHLRIFRFLSADDGAAITNDNGISWGTVADPFRLDVVTSNVTQTDGSSGNTTHLQFQFPTAGTDPANPDIFSLTPYDCLGTIDCASVRFRSRFDVYQNTATGNPASAATAPTYALVDRSIQWWQIDGLNLNGSKVNVWADATNGLSLSLDLYAHIDRVRSTRATRTNASQYAGGNINVDYTRQISGFGFARYQYTELARDINKTHPYASDDSPNFDTPESLIDIRDIDIELHLGHLAYQPINIKRVFRATNTFAPSGGVVQPDTGLVDLAIEIAPITSSTATQFYSEPKGNISIGNLRIGADSAGNCADPRHTICDFGTSTITGLQIQYLSFQTQDLPPLTNSHCPSGWYCSFLPAGHSNQIPGGI